jgi:hypothetical protein
VSQEGYRVHTGPAKNLARSSDKVERYLSCRRPSGSVGQYEERIAREAELSRLDVAEHAGHRELPDETNRDLRLEIDRPLHVSEVGCHGTEIVRGRID